MLLSLSIKDLVLIDSLHITVEDGLSVLTGETGAGKSILLDALGLALGMRGDTSLIRQGAEQAVVAAEFEVAGHPAITQLLMDHGLVEPSEETLGPLVFRRILSRAGSPTGRSRAFINDQMVSVGLLRLLGDALLEIHGQFDRLLDPTSYRTLLDEFAKAQNLREEVQRAFQNWQHAHKTWQEAQSMLTTLQQNEGFLRQQLVDLKKLNPIPGEEGSLLKTRENFASAGKLSEAIQEAARHLTAPSVESALHGGIKALQRAQGAGGGKVDAAVEALERAMTEVVEATAQIQDVATDLADQPRRLQEIDERLYALRAAARKHGVVADNLGEFQEALVQQLASLDQAADVLAHHEKAAAAARDIYAQRATKLHHCRDAGAHLLQQAVMAELPALKLDQAQFQVHVNTLPEGQWGESGFDRVDFMVAMNKGQELCSVSKSASGGELARLMLALKVALASRSAVPTIIFDEIDTGVGGAVAAAIGERLAALAKHVQVLAITHSPQLAACADHHFLVYKEDQGAFMRTSIRALALAEREDELARMLSGTHITTEARAAAGRLLSRAS